MEGRREGGGERGRYRELNSTCCLVLQDVSRLVDLCRQCIAFEDIQDLTSCLRAIEADPDIEVVRVKNRLDSEVSSARSGGYRDVALNMRIKNPTTVHLGVDLHICELQLILKSIARLKVQLTYIQCLGFKIFECCRLTRLTLLFPQSDEGHRRYVIFRDLRAE